MAGFNRVDITLSVDGGDILNEIDLARLAELHSHYNKLARPEARVHNVTTFDRVQARVEEELANHIRRYPTCLSNRNIHIRGAFFHAQDDFDHHIVMLPRRATWDAVNHGYDYLCADRPEIADMEYDSTIRHWAAAHLAKFLDIDRGFSRLPSDKQDCFNLILCLQKAMRHTYKTERMEGVRFNIALRGEHPNRDPNFYYLSHRCQLMPS